MSSLDTAITLDDVFAVVAAKRVPLAAELAGYLALEVADGTDAGSGDVDPKTVFISEEGTVALVRPKKESVTGDAEASVRGLLVRLLEASGSSTPALGVAAKRKPGNGLPALVEELEAALIPVNRAAGRRALARLSREVKRVTQGVGRNASAAPVPPAAPSPPTVPTPPEAKSVPPPPPAPAPPTPPPPPAPAPPAPPPKPVEVPPEPEPKHDPLAPTPIAPRPKTTSIPPPPVKGTPSGPPGPPPQPQRPPGPPSALFAEGALPAPPSAPPSRPSVPPPLPTPTPSPAAPARRARNDEVDALLGNFGVSSLEDKQLSRDLKAMAGLSPTPPHPESKTLADLAKDIGKGPLPRRMDGNEDDSVAALLALADASMPAPDVSANAGLPPVNAKGPPSSIFGGQGAGAAAPGAPAILRQSGPSLPDAPPSTPPPRKTDPSREVFQRTSPSDANEPSAPTQRRRAAEPPRAPKTSMALLVLALLALGGATLAIYKYAPHVFVGHPPLPPPSQAALPTAARPLCRLTLVVTDAPPRSEILLRVGQAPVDVEKMPVGARLELVATAEGYAPRRAVIPAESVWDKGPDGKPRIEIPIQLDPSHPKPGTLDPWPGAEPSSEVGGSGAPGTVHVVSNVRGAEVWLMAGLGPDAKMEQQCDGDVDVLIAGPPAVRKRLHVSDKEIAAAAPDAKGNKTVTVSAAHER